MPEELSNTARTQILESLIDLYAPEDSETMLKRMPVVNEDEDGVEFLEYFNMLQTIFDSSNDDSLTTQEAEILSAELRLTARKFGYPKDLVVAIKCTNT